MPTISFLHTHQRQVHLDFHTSPFIPDVAAEFDAQAFAQTFADAHVNSVTVFAKCHHGQCYYPTQTGTQHPALMQQGERDLLGEQIDALHSLGIRAPIYTTIAWEEDSAQKHPEWRQMKADGTFAQIGSTDNSGHQSGGWRFLDFTHPDYLDYIEAHLTELLDRYGGSVDGFFFDIVMFDVDAGWSDASRAFRQARGLIGTDSATHDRFETAAQTAFGERFTRLVTGRRPAATVFYNSHTYSSIAPPSGPVGIRARQPFQTHFELESLPSGFWGYQHFPRMARQVKMWNVPWLGMTGRFQKQWGDFGGVKPRPALEYECFRAQALGGANSVGDQLPPRGMLDRAAYKLIGAVYEQCEQAEAFYAGSQPVPQVGVVVPGYPGLDKTETDKSLEGAVAFCEEAHYDCAVVDDQSDVSGLAALLLPDSVTVTPALVVKLTNYYAQGGKLLLSHRAGFNPAGEWALPFLPLSFHGETEVWPTFWRARQEFDAELALSDRVCYARGLNVSVDKNVMGGGVLVERVPPYFQRTDAHFCSHFQTPPVKDAGLFPAVVGGEQFAYFADPCFREVRQTGNGALRDGLKAALRLLIGPPAFGDGLPTTVLCVPRRRGRDLLLTLLHYVPVRKALDIDVIEERMGFAGLTLSMPGAEVVRVFGTGETLVQTDNMYVLPAAFGRLLLEVPNFFNRFS